MPGLLGEKIGMTQIFTKTGKWLPVTVVKAGPCTIVQKKLLEKEGYSAVQLGYKEQDAKKMVKPRAAHFAKQGVKPFRVLQEFRTSNQDMYKPGDQLTVELFHEGDLIHVSATSKGKGFQGVMKRHNFKGGRATHGCSISHRSPGSVGQRTYPGKIFKNKKMAGQMGNEKVTVKNLTVVGVEAEQNLLLIKGAVPGANHALVTIFPSSQEFEKRVSAKKAPAETAKAEEKVES